MVFLAQRWMGACYEYVESFDDGDRTFRTTYAQRRAYRFSTEQDAHARKMSPGFEVVPSA